MLYLIALFLHVTGALMLAAAVATEWVCLAVLRKSSTSGNAADSLSTYAKASMTGEIGLVIILIPGIYMAAVAWRTAAWVAVGFVALIMIGAIGGAMSGKKIRAMKDDASKLRDITPEFRKRTLDNSLGLSIRLRTFIILGVVFMMTVKPTLAVSLIVLIISVILGFLPIGPRVSPEAVGGATK